MGEVYRARDTRLSRNVAIKVLPVEFARDARLRARFDREAKTISALDHPHICALHDIGRENGIDYLVLEYCEGTTLASRLERGPLPIDEVVQFGVEIADALSRAHRAGIVHRDLKPSNIMLTKSGVKLLDFGLAKQSAVQSSGDTRATTSLRDPISEEGTFLGTVPYMAPEVLAGREADARSDIFALGVVLYEMLTGKPAFSGSSTPSVMASILEREPQPIRELQPNTPPALEHIIQKCLAKDPDKRTESAHDIAEELRWSTERASSDAPPRTRIWLVAGVGLAIAVLAAIWAASRRTQSDAVVRRIQIAVPQHDRNEEAGESPVIALGNSQPNVAMSPDGKRIAFVTRRGWGTSKIQVRELDSFESLSVADGDAPFFSPDGQWIGFFRPGYLLKVPAGGGALQTLYTGSRGSSRGATWAPDGSIYFAPGPGTGLWKIPASGGAARELTRPDGAVGENSHRWPAMLPDGRHLIFTIRTDRLTTFDDAKIAVLSLETGKWRVVLEGGSCARYAPSGHLVFGRAGSLYAVPFDLNTLTVTGERRRVVEGVTTIASSGAADFGLSSSGDLVYVPGSLTDLRTEILHVNRAGDRQLLAVLPFRAEAMKMSPTKRAIALIISAANDDVAVYDLDALSTTRLSLEPGDEWAPVWTADGSRVIYTSTHPPRLLVRRADGAGDAIELLRSVRPGAGSCSPDGTTLVYFDHDAATGFDLWLLPLDGRGKPRPFLRTPFNETAARFSPDGKWIVYMSDEAGSNQVYVRSASTESGRWQLSTTGGWNPLWSSDGSEVFYRNDNDIFAVPLSTSGSQVRADKSRLLFSLPTFGAYDVVPDGFVISRETTERSTIRHVNVVLNWKHSLMSSMR